MTQATTLIILFLLALSRCNEPETTESFKITDFEFNSFLGNTSKDPKSIYCLLGSGFFRTPRSDNSDSLIAEWIKAHPNAIVIPVSSFGPIETEHPESKMVYCWVIDNNDTLNNFLIKNGCFPGGTMVWPKTLQELKRWERESYEDTDEQTDVKFHIDEKTYENFIEQIKVAELYARDNKLGIWAEKTDE